MKLLISARNIRMKKNQGYEIHVLCALIHGDMVRRDLGKAKRFFFFFFLSALLSLAGNSGHLTRVRHSSCRNSATHSYQCVQ